MVTELREKIVTISFLLACCLYASSALTQDTPKQSKILSHLGLLDNSELFDSIRENQKVANSAHETVRRDDSEIADIKAVLSSLLSKVNDLERRDVSFKTPATKRKFCESKCFAIM